MDDRGERTIIISSRELADHAVLSRKKNELAFKRDFLLKAGAKEGDLHLKAIDEEASLVGARLAPIEEKLSIADMITLLPSRREIAELSGRINQYSRPELDLAVKGKSGDAYELMRKRAVLVKGNFERREDIARMTVFLNTLPRKEGEALRALIEDGAGADVDVGFLPKEKQQELVNLSARLGRQCCVYVGGFSLDKKKVETADLKSSEEVLRAVPGGRQVWVPADRAADFEENERGIAALLAKIQAKNAEKQARQLSEEETVYLDKVQNDYIAAVNRRGELARGAELGETARLYKKRPEQDDGDGY